MAADPRTLNVTCPHCAARYLLPAHLLGPGGARVRCPGCARSFDVAPPVAELPRMIETPAPLLKRAPAREDDVATAEAEARIESELRDPAVLAGFTSQPGLAPPPGPGESAVPDAPEVTEVAEAPQAPEVPELPVTPELPEMAEAMEAMEAMEVAGTAPPEAARANATPEKALPETVAREVLEAVARRAGTDLSAAAAAGHLFAQYGPQIFAAFDEYRKRAGAAGSAPFRAALRGLWGVDLPETTRRR